MLLALERLAEEHLALLRFGLAFGCLALDFSKSASRSLATDNTVVSRLRRMSLLRTRRRAK